jgi:urease accessory protein
MFALFRNSPALELVRGPLAEPRPGLPRIELAADRFTLAKRRWRGRAADGREFGFDLARPLRHGDIFFQSDEHSYSVVQDAEPVLRISLTARDEAARVAWTIGNLHFPVEVRADCLLVEDDPTLRSVLEREGVAFATTRVIFQPLGGAMGHHH